MKNFNTLGQGWPALVLAFLLWGGGFTAYSQTVNVTFQVDMTGVDVTNGVYVTGAMEDPWRIIPMTLESGNIYSVTLPLAPGATGAYYFKNANNWDAGTRETVPAACATWWDPPVDRGYVVGTTDTTFAFKWGSCEAIGSVTGMSASQLAGKGISVYPNPSLGNLMMTLPTQMNPVAVTVLNFAGQTVFSAANLRPDHAGQMPLDVSELPRGMYLLRVSGQGLHFGSRFVKE